MRYRKASHYLLVKIDGARAPACGGGQYDGTLDMSRAGCSRGWGADPRYDLAVQCINNAILRLEQTYHNVHVAEIDYSKERCPGGEQGMGGPYLHFGKNEGVAKSIFGRIMCHAVFHRPTGDLRWVGAVPNAKTGPGLPMFA